MSQQLQLSEMASAHKEALLHSNIEQIEIERRRIATDLHDELGGIFSTLKLKINQLDKGDLNTLLLESREIIDAGIGSVRRISHSITPPGLEMFGLADALQSLCEKTDSPQLRVAFFSAPDFPRLDPNSELGLYRIAQELINNSIRHSQASEIQLHLTRSNDSIVFEYQDNGKGFDLQILQLKKGLGLNNIEARAHFIQAEVEWQSQLGKGMKATIRQPERKDSL